MIDAAFDADSSPVAVCWSSEAEQSVLGALLLDNDALEAVSGLIDEASFWHAAHRTVFAVVGGLIAASQPADVITVYERLQNLGKAEDVGGLPYLSALAQSVPSASNIRRYASIVADKALRRQLSEAASQIIEHASSAESADDAVDLAQSALGGVKRLKAGSEPRSAEALLMGRIAHWEALEAGDVTPGISTGIESLDDILVGGIKPGRVIVLAARPSVGKTSLATQVAVRVAEQGHPALLLSQEMQADELIDRITANIGRVSLGALSTGKFQGDDWTRLSEAADRVRDLPLDIDDQPALTLLDIRAKARQVKRKRGGLALVAVDYLQLCSGTGKANSRHHEIEVISRGLKALAKELDLCVVLLSQLNRSAAEGEPESHHLKESGAVEEDADVVILLHPVERELDGTIRVLVKVAKNRGGRRGRLALAFHGATQRWDQSSGDVSRQQPGGTDSRAQRHARKGS